MALRAGRDGPLATGTSIYACRATCSPPHAPIQMRRSVAAPVDEDPEQGNLRLGGPEGSPAEVDRLRGEIHAAGHSTRRSPRPRSSRS